MSTEHAVAGLVTWTETDFTWKCTCGAPNTEPMPEGADISTVAPGECQFIDQEPDPSVIFDPAQRAAIAAEVKRQVDEAIAAASPPPAP